MDWIGGTEPETKILVSLSADQVSKATQEPENEGTNLVFQNCTSRFGPKLHRGQFSCNSLLTNEGQLCG